MLTGLLAVLGSRVANSLAPSALHVTGRTGGIVLTLQFVSFLKKINK